MFTPTKKLTVLLRWDDSHNNLNLNYTLCTVVGTIWCDKSCWHSNCSSAPNNSEETKSWKMNWSFKLRISKLALFRVSGCGPASSEAGCSLTFLAFVLSPSCAMNSVCISLFPLSVNERYTCLWKCTPCNLQLFFPGSVRIHSHIN